MISPRCPDTPTDSNVWLGMQAIPCQDVHTVSILSVPPLLPPAVHAYFIYPGVRLSQTANLSECINLSWPPLSSALTTQSQIVPSRLADCGLGRSVRRQTALPLTHYFKNQWEKYLNPFAVHLAAISPAQPRRSAAINGNAALPPGPPPLSSASAPRCIESRASCPSTEMSAMKYSAILA